MQKRNAWHPHAERSSETPSLVEVYHQTIRSLEGWERRLYTFLMEEAPVRGRVPAVAEAAEALRVTQEAVRRGLNHLEGTYRLLACDPSGEIAFLDPISRMPTAWRVTLRGGRPLYAVCAAAALGLPVVYGPGMRAQVSSGCHHCGEPIRLDLEVTPTDLLVRGEDTHRVSLFAPPPTLYVEGAPAAAVYEEY